ncbi:MAG: hypothetical protein GYA17_21965 [Chloroflexi bacterium]|nr:hypothetical protein [Chloroflexota bacterium]
MPTERQVYLLDPQKLSPETIAVTFAKTSRSPQSFAEIAQQLTDEKSAEFHEKWVVGYGHASVAEHAVLHVAVENISRLAVETLESNRLASYTEKSSRYQKWENDRFYRPAELANSPLQAVYAQTCQLLFDAYLESLPQVQQWTARQFPQRPDESPAAWERRIRTEYVDVCRFILPAAALANVGMTINARALEHGLRKMLSHPLEEVRAIGAEIKAAAQAEVPTLVKYAEVDPYLQKMEAAFTDLPLQGDSPQPGQGAWCTLVAYDTDPVDRLLAAVLYRYGETEFRQARARVAAMPAEQKRSLLHTLLGSLGRHDNPLRELEHTSFTFDVTIDQGGYFELKRHRMMTQSPQRLTTHLGYALPRAILESGFEPRYRQAMQAAAEAYEQIAQVSPEVAAYVVPNAYNRRVLLTTNLRSVYHLINLRTAPNAHFSVRRLAQCMAEQITACCPALSGLLPAAAGESWDSIERQYFTQTE